MDVIAASTESYVDRHLRLWQALRTGMIADAERLLFLLLLEDLPTILAATPVLFAVSWYGGRCDLLFTDGAGTWCAVEVKRAPAIEGTGSRRKNDKTTWKRRYDKLVEQTAFAAHVGPHVVGVPVRAVGLWREDGAWRVIAEFVADRTLEHCA